MVKIVGGAVCAAAGIDNAIPASSAAIAAAVVRCFLTTSDPAELFSVRGGGDDVVAAGAAIDQRMQRDRHLVAGLEGGRRELTLSSW